MVADRIDTDYLRKPAESGSVPPPRRRRGFLFWGCVTVMVLLALIIITSAVLGRKFKILVYQHTDTAPLKIERVHVEPDAKVVAESKMTALAEAIEAGKELTVELTAVDLNVLMRLDQAPELQNAFALTINEDLLVVEMSMPMQLIFPDWQDRFFNGTMHLRIGYENKILQVHPEKILIRSQELPENMMKYLRDMDIAGKIYEQSPELETALMNIDSLKISDNKIVVRTAARKD